MLRQLKNVYHVIQHAKPVLAHLLTNVKRVNRVYFCLIIDVSIIVLKDIFLLILIYTNAKLAIKIVKIVLVILQTIVNLVNHL